MPLAERHGLGGGLEGGLEELLRGVPQGFRFTSLGDVARDDQDGGGFAGRRRLPAGLGLPVPHAAGSRVAEVDGFGLPAGQHPLQAGGPQRFIVRRGAQGADGAANQCIGLQPGRHFDGRVGIQHATGAVVAHDHIGHVVGQGLQMVLAAGQCAHRAVQAPRAVGHGCGHQQGEAPGQRQDGPPAGQHAVDRQGVHHDHAVGLAAEALVADDAFHAVDHGRSPEHPAGLVIERGGHVAVEAATLLLGHHGMAHQQRGGPVGLEPEQAHAAALGQAFGFEAPEKSVSWQPQLVGLGGTGPRLAPQEGQHPALAFLAGQFRHPHLIGNVGGGPVARGPAVQFERQAQRVRQRAVVVQQIGRLQPGRGAADLDGGATQPEGLVEFCGQAPDLPLRPRLGEIQGRVPLGQQQDGDQRDQQADGHEHQRHQPPGSGVAAERGGGRLAG